ncbi:MAG: 2Fe-2S iron-sulfur cluster binding domain-containing protein [Hydrogenibacillus sp.]|nr:2Fe-2S iron-sulfur cluster binding domain-containing protein [Hydrogenibacillus sp.]
MTIETADLSFTVEDGETILGAARRNGIYLPFECGWGSCGTCKATLISGEIRYLLENPPAISERDRKRGRIAICQATPVSDVILRASVLERLPEHLQTRDVCAVVESIVEVTPDLTHFYLRPEEAVSYEPGQYAIFRLGPELRRAYSMANLPGDEAGLEFIIRRYPGKPGSEAVFRLRPGSRVMLEFPYGGAYFRMTGRPNVLVAGGTGIAPMLAIARALVARRADPGIGEFPHYLFYGARSPVDLAGLEALYALSARFPQLAVVPVVDVPDAEWRGETGLVTDVLERRLSEPWSAYTFYVAGPPVMVNAVVRRLRDRGVPLTQVYYDAFG